MYTRIKWGKSQNIVTKKTNNKSDIEEYIMMFYEALDPDTDSETRTKFQKQIDSLDRKTKSDVLQKIAFNCLVPNTKKLVKRLSLSVTCRVILGLPSRTGLGETKEDFVSSRAFFT